MEVKLFEGGCMGHRNLFQMGENVHIRYLQSIKEVTQSQNQVTQRGAL